MNVIYHFHKLTNLELYDYSTNHMQVTWQTSASGEEALLLQATMCACTVYTSRAHFNQY
jgi:hypothetical protein